LGEGDTIFVSIVSFRDQETLPTIISIFQKARYPERIVVGLVLQIEMWNQSQEDEKEEEIGESMSNSILNQISNPDQLPSSFITQFQDLVANGQIRTIFMDWREAKGPLYARCICLDLIKVLLFIFASFKNYN